AACGGPGPIAPNGGGTDLRVVQCVPAPPPPQVDSNVVGYIGVEALEPDEIGIATPVKRGRGMGWAGGGQLSGVHVNLPKHGTVSIGTIDVADPVEQAKDSAILRGKLGELKA